MTKTLREQIRDHLYGNFNDEEETLDSIMRCIEAQYEDKAIEGYMCSVDFDYHLGNDAAGTVIYSSEECIRERRLCVAPGGCGIFKVKTYYVETIQKEELEIEA